MFELNQLEQLVTIANAGTISKAADILLISQPAITRSIQRLEDELGLKLFDRKKNKVILNDTGQLAVEYAKKILEDSQKMISGLQVYDRSHHTISIGSCAPAPIWGLTYIFHNMYPEMKVTDKLHSDEKQLIDDLKQNQYSVIVLNHSIDDEQLECIKLFKENLYLSVPPAHPLALLNEISFDDLNGESVLLLSRIGFWNEVCLKNIPDSHLLIQEDVAIFNELKKASALPSFRTDITLKRTQKSENRVYIPFTDKEAHAQYYAIYKKQNKKLFDPIQNEVNHIKWKNT